jgi:hypothetical protein
MLLVSRQETGNEGYRQRAAKEPDEIPQAFTRVFNIMRACVSSQL